MFVVIMVLLVADALSWRLDEPYDVAVTAVVPLVVVPHERSIA